MFRTLPLPIIWSFLLYTQQWYVSYTLLTACEQDQDATDPAHKLSAKLYVLLCVQRKTPHYGQRNLSGTCRVLFQE